MENDAPAPAPNQGNIRVLGYTWTAAARDRRTLDAIAFTLRLPSNTPPDEVLQALIDAPINANPAPREGTFYLSIPENPPPNASEEERQLYQRIAERNAENTPPRQCPARSRSHPPSGF
ncbi:hypothetical protein HDU98_003611 [Podochytrium sp. JEL0797]|nr:hypothetical protein HDU98_003611 [Podochytrium sp. JEL0797]